MAPPARPRLIITLLFVLYAATLPRSSASRSPDFCPNFGLPFVHELGSQCPRWIELLPPIKVTGEIIEWELSMCSSYQSILFYAPWCPFSTSSLPIFDTLSSMFPQIEHLTVDGSSVMPSVLSRYAIHSFPAILLMNCTMAIRYRGSMNPDSFVKFYKKTTGLTPIGELVIDQRRYSENKSPSNLQVNSLRELVKNEPYVAIGILFICLRIIMCMVPLLYRRIRVLWVSHSWHLNLGFLPGSIQLLLRLLNVFDVKSMWSKLGLFNRARDFRKGAKSARVWASSLTSVSLGESSSSRLSHLD